MAVIFIQYAVLLLNYRRAVNVREKYTGRAAKLSGLEYNLFAGIQKLKLTGSENRAFARWLDHYSEPPRFIYNPAFKSRLYPTLAALVGIGGTMLIFWNTLANGVSTSDYIAFGAAFGIITSAIAQLHLLVPNLAQIKPMLESVKPILEAVPEMEEKAPQVEDLFGGIEISGVSFRYQEDGPLILRRPFPQHHHHRPVGHAGRCVGGLADGQSRRTDVYPRSHRPPSLHHPPLRPHHRARQGQNRRGGHL